MLDLFSGGGGAARGYQQAGFYVVGVDINRQSNYAGDEFHQADVFAYLNDLFMDHDLFPFDVIHASPPCQAYTRKATDWGRKRNHWIEHPDLLAPTRDLLKATGLPYVIENVPGAPIDAQLMLCGSMFGLRIRKHRLFEANWPLPMAPATCNHEDLYNPWAGAGRSADKLREAMGIDWLPISGGASRKAGYTGDLFNAIPPPYTSWIGAALLRLLEQAAGVGRSDTAMSPEPTKMRLAAALREIGLETLADEAERGMYDDYESPLAFPLITLVHRLGEATTPAANALAARVKDGEFDGTKAESDAWFEREGRHLFDEPR